jgi:hypothetical protein
VGTVWVSVVKFRSTHLKTLLAAPARGTPAIVVGPTVAVGNASGHGQRLLYVKSVGRTSPTYVYNRYKVVKYSSIHKKDIYKKKLKINKNF